jgi:hypothetical protein
MKKQWVKNTGFNYTFWMDEKKIGEMEIYFNTIARKAICTIGGKVLEIKRTGFWKSNLEITDSNEAIVLKTYPEKWYANTSIIEYANNKYKLIIRNNPLAEFVITENELDLLAYGLSAENKELKVSVSGSGEHDFIFDFLLWYLFIPIANENFGDDYSFLIAQS